MSKLIASDWLMLQGTEPAMFTKNGQKVKNTIKTPQFWGFAQLKYEKNYSDTIEVSGVDKSAFAYVAPDLKRQKQFQVYRARLGLRGTLDDENKINYFTLTEFGKNGISEPMGYSQDTYVTDASISLRYIPYANIRFGLFKYPGSEEGLQARFASPFIQFTQMSNSLLLEKSFKTEKNIANTDGSYQGEPSRSVGAFRDTGIELFDRVKIDNKWALSYALMVGNGSGLEWNNENEGEYTGYAYLAAEHDFGKGKGYYHEDLKTYIWYQEGKRALYANNQTELYDRIRYGAGVRYYKKGLRLEAEYTAAQGMIVAGVVDQDPLANQEKWYGVVEAGDENRAYGYYLSSIYEFYPNVEAMIRYDELNNLTNSELKERVFETTTVGISYRFKGATRIDLNYLFREGKAPGNEAAQNVLHSLDDVLILQFTYKFGFHL
ncbi:hypothetical protein ACFLR3_03805 [Campylobacterota bacterium]